MKKLKRVSFASALAGLLLVSPVMNSQAATTTITKNEVLTNSTKTTLNTVLNTSRLATGVSVRDAKTGKTLYTYNAKNMMSTASNMKLLTGSAALSTLGENYRFTTTVKTTGKLKKNGTLMGDVYLVGQGDPTLHKSDLTNFAKALQAKGIKKINGHVYGDESWFDNRYLAPGINKTDSLTYYGAPVSALATSPNNEYDTGTVVVYVKGLKEGKAPKVAFSAQGHLEVVNKAKTVEKGEASSIKISRKYGTNKIYVTGKIAEGAKTDKWLSVDDPSKHTMTIFTKELAAAGITLKNPTYKLAVTPKNGTTTVITDKSPKLSTIMVPFMKLSNNGIADTLTKTMGKKVFNKGTNADGVKAIEQYATAHNISLKNWAYIDGSGLSHQDKVTAEQMTKFLYHTQKEKYYKSLHTSLPVAGANERMLGGTLRYRFTTTDMSNRIVAKTGSINNVRTLSGYVTQQDGDPLIISVLTGGSSSTALIDSVVTMLINDEQNLTAKKK